MGLHDQLRREMGVDLLGPVLPDDIARRLLDAYVAELLLHRGMFPDAAGDTGGDLRDVARRYSRHMARRRARQASTVDAHAGHGVELRQAPQFTPINARIGSHYG